MGADAPTVLAGDVRALRSHSVVHEAVAAALIEHETLSGHEIAMIVDRVEPKYTVIPLLGDRSVSTEASAS